MTGFPMLPFTTRLNASTKTTVLRQHFFRRFFDNDSLSWQGETETTIIRAACACAVPGLMIAFWLLPQYPIFRSTWGKVTDRYTFVLLSYVIMGIVTTFEWEMLFPDRSDFQILLPLPLQARELFLAKSGALLLFLGLFLFASNFLGLIIFSMAKTGPHGNYFYTAYAHAIATAAAGICSSASVLAVEGLAIGLLPHRWLRRVAPLLQAAMIAFFLLMLMLFPLLGTRLQPFLEGRAAMAAYLPPLWFLGLYEQLLLGISAPSGAAALARTGLWFTLIALAVAAISYPIAWSRQKRYALEGLPGKRRNNLLLYRWVDRYLLQQPQERAVFHFIHQTLFRNEHYRIYLAIYTGIGVAFTLAVAVRLQFTADNRLIFAIAPFGLRAAMPLLLFWLAVGLRMVFGFPVNMRARWVFVMHLLRHGKHIHATRVWTLLCFAALTFCITAVLFAAGWRGWLLSLQLLWGAAISLLLTDVFFFQSVRIPFTYPRLPGRVNLPITMLLFIVVFPAFVILSVYLELRSESQWTILLRTWIGIAFLHALLSLAARFFQPDTVIGFSAEEPEDEFQLLGLSAQ